MQTTSTLTKVSHTMRPLQERDKHIYFLSTSCSVHGFTSAIYITFVTVVHSEHYIQFIAAHNCLKITHFLYIHVSNSYDSLQLAILAIKSSKTAARTGSSTRISTDHLNLKWEKRSHCRFKGIKREYYKFHCVFNSQSVIRRWAYCV